jgi:DNA-binding NarL/FixJ family response regulator
MLLIIKPGSVFIKMSTAEKKSDIIIADNQFLVIEALKTVLDNRYQINNVVRSVRDLKNTLKAGIPKLLIIDYSLLDFNGFDDLREIRKLYPLMEIIILTNSLTRNELTEFNNLGIKNILHKNTDREDLISCLDAAMKGKKFYSDIFLDMIFEINEKKITREETTHLTVSEIDIIRLIAQGLTTKEIAAKKFLSFHTIMTHRKNILRKLGVSNASELIMYAVRNGIIDTIEYYI